MAERVEEYRTKLLDSVVETDEALMERYLEGEELGTEEVAHALKDAVTRGDLLLDHEEPVELPRIDFPEPVMSFAVTPKAKGDEEKVASSLRRLSEEDPTLQLRRDPQTGEQLLSGLSQMHVEVAVERLRRRF